MVFDVNTAIITSLFIVCITLLAIVTLQSIKSKNIPAPSNPIENIQSNIDRQSSSGEQSDLSKKVSGKLMVHVFEALDKRKS